MNAADAAAADGSLHSFFHSNHHQQQQQQQAGYFGLQFHHPQQQQQYGHPDLLNLDRGFDALQTYHNNNNNHSAVAAPVRSYGVAASAPANYVLNNTNNNGNNSVINSAGAGDNNNNNNNNNSVGGSAATTATPSRYESQKRRDWNTFGQYLRNHRPPLALHKCSGAHVLEFLRYLDQFGKTKVHMQGCPFFGQAQPPAACGCPLRQAWGSLDALIGRLRAAFEENGGKPESNPFGARAVRLYLREVRESQAKARGIAYEKKKRKRQTANAGGGAGAADNSATTKTTTSTITPSSSPTSCSPPPAAACISSSPSPTPSPTVSSASAVQQLILPPAPVSSLFINPSDNLSAMPPYHHVHLIATSMIPSFN